eukprot:7001409-Pyramimonas_sp.AAC.1
MSGGEGGGGRLPHVRLDRRAKPSEEGIWHVEHGVARHVGRVELPLGGAIGRGPSCLLYTSDAADDPPSVALGGR